MTTENITLQAAGAQPGSGLAELLEDRADIMALTQATLDAALQPRVPGGISHAERVALVCRMARLNGDDELPAHYAKQIPDAASNRLADPTFHGDGDTRLTALLRHVDLVTQAPKDARREDITALKDAGMAEADIVRLAELIAFVNYQIRVISGFRLLGEIA